jgi:hypothetical protein
MEIPCFEVAGVDTPFALTTNLRQNCTINQNCAGDGSQRGVETCGPGFYHIGADYDVVLPIPYGAGYHMLATRMTN